MNNKKLAAYGTKFEDPDDDSRGVSKKPTPIQDQIATDEHGKRRFHGAFTGGFSAGYWNTVGSKHGWVPQVFSSTRGERGDKVQQKAEDFMDAEVAKDDRTSTFGEDAGQRKLAWERDSTSVSTIAQMLETIVRPVSDSIGVKMLRAMGWREGRGIGLTNATQTRIRGGKNDEAEFERSQTNQIAPGYQFGQEDAILQQLQPLEGVHGLGYQGLRDTAVLDERFGQKAVALKMNKKGKGIRGQAFGVGVFEEDDDSVYTNYDLSEFDFSLDVSGRRIEVEAKKIDATFKEQSTRLNPRKFFAPPRLPPNFRAEHKVVALDAKRLPAEMQTDVRSMTAIQRAKFLGEERVSVLELVKDKDRRRLERGRNSRWDVHGNQEPSNDNFEQRDRELRNRVAFPDNPMKQARFKEYLLYIRRGLPYPQPTDSSVWEWEAEKKEFEAELTSEERGMLPEVMSRSQPLAKYSLAAPIKEILQNKFVKESGAELQVGTKDEDKLAAVKSGMFGDKTRSSFQWYPDNGLVRRFNVPNPYPGSDMVGVPELQKAAPRRETVLNLGLPNTANELRMREERMHTRKVEDETLEEDNSQEDQVREEEEDAEKAPKSFFDFVFGDLDSDDDSDDSDVGAKRKEKERKRSDSESSESPEAKSKMGIDQERRKSVDSESSVEIVGEKKKVMTVMDIPSTYGPSLPTEFEANQIPAFSVLRYLQEDLRKRREEKKERRRRKEANEKGQSSSKTKKKKKDKKKKEKKTKKTKKKSKNQKHKKGKESSSSGSSSDWTSDDKE